MQCLIEILISDKIWFLVLQVVLTIFVSYALFKDIKKNKSLTVGRSNESKKMFVASAGAIITALISIVFQISSYPVDGKVLLYLSDLVIISYLCFYSPWFTNKLVELKDSFEKRTF